MLAGIRSRLTYANVMASIAVFIALGGVAWAAATIESSDVVDDSLKSVDLKDAKAVKGVDVKDESLAGADVEDRSLQLVDFSVRSFRLIDHDPPEIAAHSCVDLDLVQEPVEVNDVLMPVLDGDLDPRLFMPGTRVTEDGAYPLRTCNLGTEALDPPAHDLRVVVLR